MSRRRYKPRRSEGLFALAMRLPWWASLLLALIAYLVLSKMAGPPSAVPGRSADAAMGAVFRGAAMALQYLLPALLLAASLGAFLRAGRKAPAAPGSMAPPRREPALTAAPASPSPPEQQPAPDILDQIAARRFAPAAELARPTDWSIGVLQRMDWKNLELVAAAYYRRLGFKAVTQECGADGGIDIRLYRGEGAEPFAIVQCKARSSQPLGVAHVRELLGVMTHTQVRTGVLVCTSGFTREAVAFATSKTMALIDGSEFLAKIRALPAEAQAELLALATEGDWTTPTCASCGTKMLLRQSQRGPFWGCTAYPRCKNTLQLSREQRAGVAA